jgi:CO/xanthine dehydrogenase Mo-binding subunit
VKAFGVETNHVGTGSYRGPGGPQASFALESLIDDLAAQLNLDPIDIRQGRLECRRRADGSRLRRQFARGGDQFGAPDPLHAALHDRVFDADEFGESGLEHCCPLFPATAVFVGFRGSGCRQPP